jgi:signal peptidase I
MPTASMQPTLMVGDVFQMQLTGLYGSGLRGGMPTFDRGDIVIFYNSVTSEYWTKRIIGVAGDRVRMEGGRLYINDELVPRTLVGQFGDTDSSGLTVMVDRYVETLPGGFQHLINEISDEEVLDNTVEMLVPEGTVFVLGDNRDRSADSRVAEMVGCVDINSIVAFSRANDELFFWYRKP